MDLFARQREQALRAVEPLPVRLRPRTLDEFVGQDHFLGPGKLLRRLLDADRLTSAIFYGPPGTGKTALAHVIAHRTRAHFEPVNAAEVGVREIRDILHAARDRLAAQHRRTVLFVDELHRFNRAQQDVLLPDVEKGVIILIGATTENPFFAVNPPLVSRSHIFQFEPLTPDQVATLLRRALTDPRSGFEHLDLEVTDEAIEYLARMCDGDARRALSALEVAVLSQLPSEPPAAGPGDADTPHPATGTRTASAGPSPRPEPALSPSPRPRIRIDRDVAAECIQRKAIAYDATGDQHYDAASAFIKSMRGSDPDAAVYWLAYMLEAGEDPRFIARRIVIAAAEDVGNADPMAIVVANAAADITDRVGMPECALPLAQAAIYIACAPKSNASAQAVWAAIRDVREQRTVPVPRHLRDASYRGARRLGHGRDYEYPHDAPEGYVEQEYLGVDRTYYLPVPRGHEATIRRFLERLRRAPIPSGPEKTTSAARPDPSAEDEP